uniref:Uncharacterized protein n=1 Tax=Cacopsylla melanoneura TaxID=428564 RepID=A0A8D8W7B9_9HEMI
MSCLKSRKNNRFYNPSHFSSALSQAHVLFLLYIEHTHPIVMPLFLFFIYRYIETDSSYSLFVGRDFVDILFNLVLKSIKKERNNTWYCICHYFDFLNIESQ